MNPYGLKTPLLMVLLALMPGATAAAQTSASSCSQCAEWNRPQKPFHIFGNSYYVGTHGISSILVSSKAGHVLIDGALPQSAEQIASNIRTLGFRVEDIRIILSSHVHFDHAGGIAELQRLSGARVLASPWSASVLKNGGVGRGDPQYGEIQPIAAVQNVHEVRDGETVQVGETVMTMHLTPGHTPGGTSWTWKSCEGPVCRAMVFADSLTPVSAKGYLFSKNQALVEFERSFAFLESTPCDVLITTHPDVSGLWERVAARERGVNPDPLVNDKACRDLARSGRERLHQRLGQERSQ